MFSRWLAVSGGTHWKALRDMTAMMRDQRGTPGLMLDDTTSELAMKLQPRLMMRSVFLRGGKLNVEGYDGRTYWSYKEKTPFEQRHENRDLVHGDVDFDAATQPGLRQYFNRILFWLGQPFVFQVPGTRLCERGILLDEKENPLYLMEVDLTRVKEELDVDLLIFAMDGKTGLPRWADFRWVEDGLVWRCVFRHYRRSWGMTFPEYRDFYDETQTKVRTVRMYDVRFNRIYPQSLFAIPGRGGRRKP